MSTARKIPGWSVAVLAAAAMLVAGLMSVGTSGGSGANAAGADVAVSYGVLGPRHERRPLVANLPPQVLGRPHREGTGGAPTASAAPATSALATGGPAVTLGTTIDGLRNPVATPPDTQVAVGPSEVIEMVNNSASIWSKSGALVAQLDLNTLFGIPELVGSDPRILYDAAAGRFYATYISFNPPPYNLFFGNDTTVQILWSLNNAPAGYADWNGCSYLDTTGRLHDNPAIGFSDDKIAIGSDVFAWPDAAQNPSLPPIGADTILIDKSTALSNTTPCPGAYLGPASAGNIRPAQALSAGSSLYMASLPETGGTTATLWTVTGSVIAQTIGRSRADLPMNATTMPPAATQSGASSTIETNDARALDAVWANGMLDVSSNTGCVPVNDSVARSCVHLLQIDTGAPAVAREVTFGGAPGEHLYFPSMRPDASANLAVVYTRSSATTAPSVSASVLDPTWSAVSPLTVRSGVGPYTGIDSSPYRWGDYSGAAVDPVDGSIWVAGEYSASAASGDWGTFIAQLKIAGGSATPTPTATQTTPAATNTPTPTATQTPAPNTPTPTATRSATSTPTATPTCVRGKAKHGRC